MTLLDKPLKQYNEFTIESKKQKIRYISINVSTKKFNNWQKNVVIDKSAVKMI